ncbi:hypothetical protein ACRBVS_004582 [Escherichia coli]
MMFRQLMFLLFCGVSIACMPVMTRAAAPVEGKDYTVLKTPVADAPAVVEFYPFTVHPARLSATGILSAGPWTKFCRPGKRW